MGKNERRNMQDSLIKST